MVHVHIQQVEASVSQYQGRHSPKQKESFTRNRDVIFAKAIECEKSHVINEKHVATTLVCVQLLVLNSITQLENK